MTRIKSKDKVILSHLRENNRQSVVDIAYKTGIPVSTIYDRIRACEKEVITKHTTLLDFAKLGFTLRVMVTLAVNNPEVFEEYVKHHYHVNSVFKLDRPNEYMIDCVFANSKELLKMMADLKDKGMESNSLRYVTESLKHEDFFRDTNMKVE
jgi:DNA-binding Lrp family transcriptional regulator